MSEKKKRAPKKLLKVEVESSVVDTPTSPAEVPELAPSTDPEKRRLVIAPLSKAELNKLAAGVVTNEVFLGSMIPEAQQRNLLGQVFLPLMFGASPENVADVGDVYGFRKDTVKMSVNGFPMHTACGFLHKDDLPYFYARIRELDVLLRGDEPEKAAEEEE